MSCPHGQFAPKKNPNGTTPDVDKSTISAYDSAFMINLALCRLSFASSGERPRAPEPWWPSGAAPAARAVHRGETYVCSKFFLTCR